MERNSLMRCIVAGVVIFIIGTGVGRYAVPNSVSKTEDSAKETETTKETIDREITAPDGTKTKERITKEEQKKKEEKKTSVVIDNKKPDYKVALLAGYSFDSNKQIYGLEVERRILGSLFIGAFGTTDHTVGLSLGYEF